MLTGYIIAPIAARPDIVTAGFDIFDTVDTHDEVMEYKVSGPVSALSRIDSRWGEWFWSLKVEKATLIFH